MARGFFAQSLSIFKRLKPLELFSSAPHWRKSLMNETGAIVKRYFQDFFIFQKFFLSFLSGIIFITSSLALPLAPSYNASESRRLLLIIVPNRLGRQRFPSGGLGVLIRPTTSDTW
jgi:hypothetical protein